MIAVLSPSKRLNYDSSEVQFNDVPEFSNRAGQLITVLRKQSKTDIMKLMKINEDLADLNYKRYKGFRRNYTEENSKAAVMAFTGDVYLGMDPKTFSKKDLSFAQDHIRILSGLYGLLRPLDAMQPYRLEMGTSLENKKGKNLYAFWGDDITKALNKLLEGQKEKVLVNLASKEYYSSINTSKIKGDILDINFKEYRNGVLKFLSFNAKKARGFMARYIVQNKLQTKESIKGFDLENYYFSEELSNDKSFTFIR